MRGKSEWDNEEAKAVMERKETAWKDALGAEEEFWKKDVRRKRGRMKDADDGMKEKSDKREIKFESNKSQIEEFQTFWSHIRLG